MIDERMYEIFNLHSEVTSAFDIHDYSGRTHNYNYENGLDSENQHLLAGARS